MWALALWTELKNVHGTGEGFIAQPYKWLLSVFKLHSRLSSCMDTVCFFKSWEKNSCMSFGLVHHIKKSYEVLMSSLYIWVSLFLSFLLQLIPCLNTSVPCLPTGLFWLLVLPAGKYLLQVRNGGLELLVCPCCPNTNSCMVCRFLKTFWSYWHSSVFVTASTSLKWSCMHGCILCLWWLAADNNAYWNINIPFRGMLVCWQACVCFYWARELSTILI